jgi:hypothetical protein
MGVPGLQTYVEQRASSACKKVNILKEAKKINEKSCWQRKKSVTEDDLQKVLIVDLLGLARKPYVGLNPWFGGDFVQYKDNWRKIVEKVSGKRHWFSFCEQIYKKQQGQRKERD